jgi:beta-mannosidase
MIAAAFLAAGGRATSLDGAWQFCELAPGRSPTDASGLDWREARVPGTVATVLGGAMPDLDEREFLYRRRFTWEGGARPLLVFDGLATLAEVWVNGRCLLSTKNMFRRHVADAGEAIRRGENELVLRFRALAPELARKRPRGRWATRLVRHRNLRYFRTSLLGRMAGWGPMLPQVGPWRGVRLMQDQRLRLDEVVLQPSLAGREGKLVVKVQGRLLAGSAPEALHLRVGDRRFRVAVGMAGEEFRAAGEVRIPEVAPWWPHDMGEPHLYPVTLGLECGSDTVDLGSLRLGFRSVERAPGDGFALRVNGRDAFCRGACWMPADPAGLADDAAEIRRVLGLVRDAGMNMVRVSGTTFYESDAFYDACDDLGILVWQDFMFARMDYPEDDPDFAREVALEAGEALARLAHRPSLAVLCGNSEVEQQAAMMGLPASAGRTPLFGEVLAEASHHWCPDVPYVASSPSGGALPFHVDAGVAHYFGVGAYLRPLADARESGVCFAAECLAFSNVPEDEALDELFGEEARVAHSPRYKAGVPRDAGAGWDFADVTDHYLEALFRCSARELRYADSERYFALARVVPGEMMARVIGLWRAKGSLCRGALVWLLRDLEPGAGAGILDRAGRPKAPYWFLKRACAPRAIWFTDEGVNGLRLHARNDRGAELRGVLRVRLLRADGVELAGGTAELRVSPGGGEAFAVDALVGRFTDSSWAYRFGPCPYAIAVAELVDGAGSPMSTAHHLPAGLGHELREDVGLRAAVRGHPSGCRVRIETRELALFVRIAAPGLLPSDNYFHLAPGASRELELPGGAPRPRIRIGALNSRAEATVQIVEEHP